MSVVGYVVKSLTLLSCALLFKAQIITNPNGWDKLRHRVRGWFIGYLQRRDARRREQFSF